MFDSVVLIDSSLSGCASTFNSITFFDGDAMNVPGNKWEYAIRTKYADSNVRDEISDSVAIKVPWRGTLEGSVYVGGNPSVPVRNVRVCAKLTSATSVQQNIRTSNNLASHMMVWHSNANKMTSAYKITDGFVDTYSVLANNEIM